MTGSVGPNLTGMKFGRLTVVERSGSKRGSGVLWNCACECGRIQTAITAELRNGHVRSCGCLMRDISREKATRHGKSQTPAYKVWCGMIERCTNPGNTFFKDYGARGITVCDRWKDFSAFLADMGERPPGLTLDRRDNDRGYEPGNCRWATKTTQARNTRTTVLLEHNGVTAPLTEWAEKLGICAGTIHSRINFLGWSVEKALTQPVRPIVRLAVLTNR